RRATGAVSRWPSSTASARLRFRPSVAASTAIRSMPRRISPSVRRGACSRTATRSTASFSLHSATAFVAHWNALCALADSEERMSEERYEPVSCDYHDELEAAAMHKQQVELEFDLDGVTQREKGTIADVYSA